MPHVFNAYVRHPREASTRGIRERHARETCTRDMHERQAGTRHMRRELDATVRLTCQDYAVAYYGKTIAKHHTTTVYAMHS